MLVLSREEVRELLELGALIDALADAMADLSAGRASVPDRIAALVPERDALLAALLSTRAAASPGRGMYGLAWYMALMSASRMPVQGGAGVRVVRSHVGRNQRIEPGVSAIGHGAGFVRVARRLPSRPFGCALARL